MLKDQKNKKSHEKSAQTACEAAGSIRTVASLTREDDCLRIYSQSLEEPLRNSNRTAIWSNLLYGFSQAMSFWVISLIFWYGSTLVASREYTVFQFFVGLMVSAILSIYVVILNFVVEYYICLNSGRKCMLVLIPHDSHFNMLCRYLHMFRTSHLPKGRHLILSTSLMLFPK